MLDGWKAIATYLRRDERTAMRWESERGLPVHRVPGQGRGTVYAVADEIDAWLLAHRAKPAPRPRVAPGRPDPPPAPSRGGRRMRAALAIAGGGSLLAAAGALGLALTRPSASAGANEPAFTDPAARAAYLQASYDFNLRTRDSLARAAREFADAIGRDPRVSEAYSGLASCYLLIREYGVMPDAVAYARAEAAARAAVALSPRSAEALRVLAFIEFWWHGDRSAARRGFASAIALKPDDPLTHHWFANALVANGEPAAALREIDRARDLDPTSTAVMIDRAAILYLDGDRPAGIAALHLIGRDSPAAVEAFRRLGEFALVEGRIGDFLAAGATVARLRGDAAGLAAIDRWRAAGPGSAAVVAAMLADARRSAARTGWFRVAQLAAAAGRRDEAIDALARACTAHEPATISARSDLFLARALSPAAVAERCGPAETLI